MAAPGWLNENSGRNYPFCFNAAPPWALPDEAILDAGFMIGAGAEYSPVDHEIWLYRAVLDGDDIILEFRATAPDLNESPLLFRFSVDSPENTVTEALREQESSSSASSLSSIAEACPGLPLWEGFLVLGDLTSLVSLLQTGAQVDAIGGWRIEPARIQILGRRRTRSINLANGDRLRVDASAGCDDNGGGSSAEHPITRTRCLYGQLRFREGYNASLRQSIADNALVIGASVGAGAGEPCEEVRLYDGENSPAGSGFLSGGPSCADTINSLNGLQGPRLRIRGGTGVKVYAGSDENEIIVDVDLSGMVVCRPDTSSSLASAG